MKIIDGTIASPLGFSADGLHAGFKKKKLDFGWIVSEVPASVAGVYTTNKVIAAPLLVTKAKYNTFYVGLEDVVTLTDWLNVVVGVSYNQRENI